MLLIHSLHFCAFSSTLVRAWIYRDLYMAHGSTARSSYIFSHFLIQSAYRAQQYEIIFQSLIKYKIYIIKCFYKCIYMFLNSSKLENLVTRSPHECLQVALTESSPDDSRKQRPKRRNVSDHYLYIPAALIRLKSKFPTSCCRLHSVIPLLKGSSY